MEKMEQTIGDILDNIEDNNKQPIRFSYMRSELLCNIRGLSDIEYQKREWLDSKYPHAFYDSLLMVSDFFEDRRLYDDPESVISSTIRNREELVRIVAVTEGVLKVFDEIGDEKPDEAYWGSELWMDVVYKARVAYEYIKNQGLDDKYIEFIERTSQQNNDQSCTQKSEPEAEKGLWDKCTSGLSNIIKTIRSKT
ncbi:MAG: hypothetical protein EOP45_14960 [Sphingobacteriaceae bacterium]|nr:MAG: hypothetical protein EOP45_14960 [Sphingobacteriaceae bacterium]